MQLVKIFPSTNGTRHQLNLKKNLLSKSSKVNKCLLKGSIKTSGRSSITGHITVRHKGKGCKKSYRYINFYSFNYKSVVLSNLYDPNRNAFISLNFDLQKFLFFNTVATNNVVPGTLLFCAQNSNSLKLGCRILLKNLPTGSLIHSISSSINNKIKYIRSAGTFCQLIQKDVRYCKLKFPSGQVLKISSCGYGTVGVVSNLKSNLVVLGKAGRNRLRGKRPSVRGIAMNPVDHPHGGRSNGGKPCVTPWGLPTKGKPTVKKI
jgi:large subunit ribosomal protein L2